MNSLPFLSTGDQVELIAPASRLSPQQLLNIKTRLESWGLNCMMDEHIFGADLLCSNSDSYRLESLINALNRPDTKAIFCARGGYGRMRLIPALSSLPPPLTRKLFVGMSDITALHLFFGQQWKWPTVHGSLSFDKISDESTTAMKDILFNNAQLTYQGTPLNILAATKHTIVAPLIGGNLCLVQASIGTLWQLQARNKIIFLEEIGERGYRLDRMLEHLKQAGIFKEASAIVFGDLLGGEEPNGTSLLQLVIRRFAETCEIPVVQIAGVGHGYHNTPLLLGLPTKLTLGNQIQMMSSR